MHWEIVKNASDGDRTKILLKVHPTHRLNVLNFTFMSLERMPDDLLPEGEFFFMNGFTATALHKPELPEVVFNGRNATPEQVGDFSPQGLL